MPPSFTRSVQLPPEVDAMLIRRLQARAEEAMPGASTNWSGRNDVGSVSGALGEVEEFVARYGQLTGVSLTTSYGYDDKQTAAAITNVAVAFGEGSGQEYAHPGTFTITGRDLDAVETALNAVSQAGQVGTVVAGSPLAERPLPVLLEEVVVRWQAVEEALHLDPDEKRTADALNHMLSELATVDEPDPGVVRATVGWMKRHVDLWSGEFAKASGAAMGKAATYGTTTVLVAKFGGLNELIMEILKRA